MRDTQLILRTAYYTTLSGNVTINATPVPVYDNVPENADFPYIKLSTQDSFETGATKDCLATTDNILIDIVTGFKKGGGKSQSELIADQVLQLIYPKITLPTGFNPSYTRKVSDTTLEEQDNAYKIYRRLIRLEHNIFQY